MALGTVGSILEKFAFMPNKLQYSTKSVVATLKKLIVYKDVQDRYTDQLKNLEPMVYSYSGVGHVNAVREPSSHHQDEHMHGNEVDQKHIATP